MEWKPRHTVERKNDAVEKTNAPRKCSDQELPQSHLEVDADWAPRTYPKRKVKNKRRKIAQPTEAMNMPAIAGAKRPPLHATLHLAGTAPRTVESKPKGHPRAAGRVMAAGPPKKRTHTRNGRGNVGHPQPPTHALTPWSAKRCVLGAPAAWPC